MDEPSDGGAPPEPPAAANAAAAAVAGKPPNSPPLSWLHLFEWKEKQKKNAKNKRLIKTTAFTTIIIDIANDNDSDGAE